MAGAVIQGLPPTEEIHKSRRKLAEHDGAHRFSGGETKDIADLELMLSILREVREAKTDAPSKRGRPLDTDLLLQMVELLLKKETPLRTGITSNAVKLIAHALRAGNSAGDLVEHEIERARKIARRLHNLKKRLGL